MHSPKQKVTPLQTQHEALRISDDLPPKVAPGVYELAYIDYRTALMFAGRQAKLRIDFRIVTFGQYFELELPAYYNIKRCIGKPGKQANFEAGSKSNLAREFLTLFPEGVTRLDRLPMSRFEKAIVLGRVRTVTHARGKPIPVPLQYSVIAELVGRA